MKNFKQLALLPIVLFGLSASAQDWTTCDDFSDLLLYPNETFVAGELIGYSQGGTQEINCVTGFANVNEFPEGIMGVGTVDYEFDGTNQIARFYMYGNMFEFDNMGFSVNGSSAVMLDGTFPMTIAGVTVDLDLSPPNVAEWDYYYLTFTGPIDVVSQIYYETAVVELCVEPLEEVTFTDCDDFTDTLIYHDDFVVGDLIGYSQGGTQEITTSGGADVNTYFEGLYGGGDLTFEFDGSNQGARFLVYGILSQFNEMGFSVNGSSVVMLDGVFPMTVAGVEVDLDLSPSDVDLWEYFYLTFTGEIDVVSHILFESGVVELCVEPLEEVTFTDCDDFTDTLIYHADFVVGDLIGYSQGGTQEITYSDGWVYVNTEGEGLYGGGNLEFEFDGSNQSARFLTYGFPDQFDEMGFSVNGSSVVMLDGAFPMTVAGVEVDLDLSPSNSDGWEYFYLTFTGDIDVVSHILFESGVVELCVEPLEETGLGVGEETTSQLTAYPNPVADVLTITSDEQLASVKIYTITGDLVFAQPVISDEIIQLSFADLQDGFYFVVGTSLNGDEFVSKIAKN